MKTALAALLFAALTGCASRQCPPIAGAPALGLAWQSARLREHPLVGRIWDVKQARFVDEAALEAAARGAGVLLLGETHDNPDHHLLQARLVRAAASGGRRPALAFEMLDRGVQPALDAALAKQPSDPQAVGDAVRWDKSGWPPFALYRPIFAAALDERLPILAANLARKEVQGVVMEGATALPLELRAAVEAPMAPEALREMREEMAESHCGKLPEELLEPMVVGQRARDAQLAATLAAAAGKGPVILIAGSGHARTDRGVPWYLPAAAREKVLAVAMTEVTRDGCTPEAYAADYGARAVPFDYVVFTPGAERDDPCKGIRPHKR
ncbi:ChaN family lipoprotein [Anaeromyxobacter paludicola]|uniref:Haem-binding uptake Tiki superfamily ChaN domain-containing protein n=1 Tax=Anaeromyxobacter paludicola TaxID=2918171 RepID=A0ABM7XFP7_9BACT|nr:ChaN family lipoprotein [Anaeromyxobacter paludicola]BDG10698.1 hypothetical protein AMPC_38110 [Anaeromyxobacter paludicola]